MGVRRSKSVDADRGSLTDRRGAGPIPKRESFADERTGGRLHSIDQLAALDARGNDMSDLSRSPGIDPERAWTARHAHRNLRIVEDAQGRIWLRVADLRQWMPGLGQDTSLVRRWPGMVRCVPPSADAYLEARTFNWLTQKSTSAPTLKLRAWLDSTVLEPARKRQRLGPSIEGRRSGQALLPMSRNGDRHTEAAGPSSWRRLLDLRYWRIAQGEWGLKTVLATGAAGSFVGVVISNRLNARGWNVDNSYLVWTWLGLTVAAWALAYNAAWMVGALRSGTRRSGDGFNPWITTAMVMLNLSAAAYMSTTTVQNSAQLVHLWWAVYIRGDPPVEVQVVSWYPDGRARRLALSGGIGIGSTQALRDALKAHPQVTELALDSPGGLVIEGFGLAQAIEASAIRTTLVLGRCAASACTLPFLQGKQRRVAPDAVVGFHRSHSILGGFGNGWGPTEHAMADLMRRRGVSEAFIQRAFATPGWDIYQPGVEVLVAEGVVTNALVASATQP